MKKKNEKKALWTSYSPAHKNYLKKETKHKTLITLGRWGLLIFLLAFWELMAYLNVIDSFITSSPSRIIRMIITLIKEGKIWIHALTTLYETVIAFVLSIVIGFVVAVVLYLITPLRKILEPHLVVLNSLPKIALGPLIIVWVGAGVKSIIVMGILICVIIAVLTMLNSFLAVSEDKIKLMKTMGANKFQILTKLVIPESFPSFISLLKIIVGMSWVGTIMGEYLVSRAGVGYLIVYGGQIFKLDLVMASIVILCLMASVMYYFVTLLEKLVNKHRQ